MYFAHRCRSCDERHLIFPSQVVAFDVIGAGDFAVTYTCWCGSEQVWFSAAPARAHATQLAA